MTVVAQQRHRTRHAASIVLLVLVGLLTPLVVTAGWAITTVTNTDRFVSTMSSLGTNPTITNYVAAQGATTLVNQLDVQARIQQKLPSGAGFLAPFATNAIREQLTKVFATVLASQKFQTIWTAKIRLLHTGFVSAMTGNGSKVSQAAQLGLDVTPQILAAITTLDSKGITVLDPARKYLMDNRILVTLAQAKQFHEVQLYFHVATTLRWVLPLVLLLLAAGAVLADHRRRRSGFWLGITVAISCVVMLALLSIGKQYAVAHSPTPPDVATAVFSTLTSWLRWELRTLVVIGLLASLILWLTGPSKHAVAARGLFAKGGGKAGHVVEGALGEHASARLESDGSTAVDGIAKYAVLLSWLGVILAAMALLLWVSSFIGAIVTVLLAIAWVAALRGLKARAAPPASSPNPS